MTILEFVCLRAGYAPAQLGLPDSVIEGAGSGPIEGVSERILPPLYRAAFFMPSADAEERRRQYDRNRRAKAKGATA